MASKIDASRAAFVSKLCDTTFAFSCPGNPSLGQHHPLNVYRSPLVADRRKIAWYMKGVIPALIEIISSSEITITVPIINSTDSPSVLLGIGIVDKDLMKVDLTSHIRAMSVSVKIGMDDTIYPLEFFEDIDSISIVNSQDYLLPSSLNPSNVPWFYSTTFNCGFPMAASCFHHGGSVIHKISITPEISDPTHWKAYAMVAYLTPAQKASIETAHQVAGSSPNDLTKSIFVRDIISLPVSEQLIMPVGGVIGIMWKGIDLKGSDVTIRLEILGSPSIICDKFPDDLVEKINSDQSDDQVWRVWWTEIQSSSKSLRIWPPPGLGTASAKAPPGSGTFKVISSSGTIQEVRVMRYRAIILPQID